MGSILMVTRNNLHLTKAAVRTALSQDTPCNLLVVDNHSTDGTIDWLKTKILYTIHLPYQKSLAYCWNIGLQTLYKTVSTEALVINNDVEIRPDTYRLLRSTNRPFVTAVGVDSVDQMHSLESPISLDYSPHPDFSCFMIHKKVTDKVGWFDEKFDPAFYEDNDYHVRMHRAGIQAVSVDLPFLHHGSQTIKNASPGEVKRIQRGADKGKERFRQKYGCIPGTPEYDMLFYGQDRCRA